jgi:HEAT repeat protein
MDVRTVIDEILDTAASVNAVHLAQLSGLDNGEAAEVVDALAQVSFERRRQIAQTLVDLVEENVDLNFDPLFRKLMEDEDEEVRVAAISGLWECEERSLIEPLLRHLKYDEDEGVRAAAAQSLGRFAMLAELGKLLERDGKRVEKGLTEVIEGEDEQSPEVRRRAVEALAPLNNQNVRDIILETYESASDKVRASAVYAMGQNADPVWAPYILDEMQSDEPEMRYEAAGAAGRMGQESFLPALARMVEDEAPDVQAAAITAISAIGGQKAHQLLRALLQHADDGVRELALDALESMQTLEPPSVDILRRQDGKPKPFVDDDDDDEEDDLDLDDDEDDDP